MQEKKSWDLNPMADAKGYLSREEVNRILEAASKQSPRNYLLILTMLYTGRRVSEIVEGVGGYGLRPMDIDFDSSNITYRILKKRPRSKEAVKEGRPKAEPISKTLPANKTLLEILRQYIQANNLKPEQFIFSITKQRAGQLVKRIGELSGVMYVGKKPLHPHHFRHTFAVWISREQIANPEDVVELKELLQHSDIRMTMTYLRYGNTKARQLIEGL